MDLPGGSSIVVYLEDDFQEPDSIDREHGVLHRRRRLRR